MGKKNVIELRRVSTEEQAGLGRAGLLRQEEVNRKTASFFDLVVLETITIVNVSGSRVLESPQMQRLLKLIRQPDIAGILVSDLDRVFRPERFSDFVILEEFVNANSLIFLPDGPLDLKSETGYITGGVRSIISGFERRKIIERMWGAKEAKRKLGKHVQSPMFGLPIGVGYNSAAEQFSYNDESLKIKKAFELILYHGVTNFKELEEKTGIHHRTLANTLRNEIWIGNRVYDKKRGSEKYSSEDGRQADKKKVRRSEGDIIRVKVIDEPLINETEFNRVLSILAEKHKLFRQHRDSFGKRWLYTGLLYCAKCNLPFYNFSRGGKGKRKEYYYCKSSHFSVKKPCGNGWVEKNKLEKIINEFFATKFKGPEVVQKIHHNLLSSFTDDPASGEMQKLHRKASNLKAKQSRLIVAYETDGLQVQALKERTLEIEKEISMTEKRLGELEAAEKKPQIDIGIIKEAVQALREFEFLNVGEKRVLLKTLVPRIYIENGRIRHLVFCQQELHPQPCGYFTDPAKECTCQPIAIQKYMAKISGPLLDRIDLHIEVPAVKYKDLSSKENGEASEHIRNRVIAARDIQTSRFKGRRGLFSNADMQSKEIREFCKLDAAGEELLKMAITKLGLSARAYDRILKVGRTIADMAGSPEIRPEHISEAIQYRSLDRNLMA